MVKKIFNKIKKVAINVFTIYIINKKYNCEISFKTNIDNLSEFEGRNSIHSKTTINNSKIGYATYICENSYIYETKIGKFCSIARDVRILGGNHPTSKYISTHPIFFTDKNFSGLSFKHENTFSEYTYVDDDKRFVCTIGNDVWIGEGVKIKTGVDIGDGAIIAAGAVVTKNIPAYAIVGGAPAKIIKYRFNGEEIKFLLNLKWWDKDEGWFRTHAKYFYDVEKLIIIEG